MKKRRDPVMKCLFCGGKTTCGYVCKCLKPAPDRNATPAAQSTDDGMRTYRCVACRISQVTSRQGPILCHGCGRTMTH